MLPTLWNDTRGQSIGFIRLFLSLIAGAAVVWIVMEVANPVLAGTRNATNNAKANEATEWFQMAVDYMPLAFLLIALFGIIALSIFQRERLR